MNTGEFELIERYFTRHASAREDVLLGVGDDAALWRARCGCDVAVTTDTLVAGVHFHADVDPEALGHKSLAVNLSDLAAMAATPRAALLALTLPAVEEAWLAAFARGFFALAERHAVALIGGDTSRGPLSITITALGEVESGRAVTRAGARTGDLIAVTGTLGDAAFALDRERLRDHPARDFLRARLERPTPRLDFAPVLRAHAHAAIDVSDGLLADLGHVLAASKVGAEIDLDAVPLSAPLRESVGPQRALEFALTGGDDYELLFTCDAAQWPQVTAAARACDTPVVRIGTVTAVRTVVGASGRGLRLPQGPGGYRHF